MPDATAQSGLGLVAAKMFVFGAERRPKFGMQFFTA
jgi:hypothetical protein